MDDGMEAFQSIRMPGILPMLLVTEYWSMTHLSVAQVVVSQILSNELPQHDLQMDNHIVLWLLSALGALVLTRLLPSNLSMILLLVELVLVQVLALIAQAQLLKI
jgi:hypothetical protein